MSISTRLSSYLAHRGIHYQALPHFHSNSSIGTAVTANIALKQVAKAVLLKDHEDRKLMAILPASNKISLSALNESLHGSYRLVKEQDVYQLFSDCDSGAVPPVADAYNMPMVCEADLAELKEIYIEAGDHETVLCLDQHNFSQIMATGKYIHFSHEVFH